MTPERTWSDEVRHRLQLWFLWTRGNNFYHNPEHPIAAMMKVGSGELPGGNIDVPVDLTPELECVEKAVARMKLQHPIPRRLLIDTYLHGHFLQRIAADRHWSEEKAKIELWRAESICSRFMIGVERELRQKKENQLFTEWCAALSR